MIKQYDFEFYTISPEGDWSLYLIKTTSLSGRRTMLKNLKSDGYVYHRADNAYFKAFPASSDDKPSLFAFIIRLHK